MSKFVLVYRGGGMPETEEAQQASMEAWGTWLGSLGAAATDWGAPFGASAAVGGGAASGGLTGYSILEADSLDAAVALGGGCPILKDGGSVEVYEAMAMG